MWVSFSMLTIRVKLDENLMERQMRFPPKNVFCISYPARFSAGFTHNVNKARTNLHLIRIVNANPCEG